MWVLIHTQPKSSRLAMRIARPKSFVHTLDASPYSTPLAQRDRLVLVAELLHRDDRSEDLALDHLVVLVQPADDGRLVEEALPSDRMPAGGDVGVIGSAVDHAADVGELVGVVDRAEQHVLVVGHARLGALGLLGERGDEVVVHAAARRARAWPRCSPDRR